MTFADNYRDHAYADLILEAETQGIGIGVQQERERIITILTDYIPDPHNDDESCDDCDLIRYLIRLINGESK